jgi:hypothetical protein
MESITSVSSLLASHVRPPFQQQVDTLNWSKETLITQMIPRVTEAAKQHAECKDAVGKRKFEQVLDAASHHHRRFVQRTMALLHDVCVLEECQIFGIDEQVSTSSSMLTGWCHNKSSNLDPILLSRKRHDTCFSQALGSLVTGFTSMIDRHFRLRRRPFAPRRNSDAPVEPMLSATSLQAIEDQLFWDCLVHCGYLAQFESLLSCTGDEKGMLDNTHTAINSLRDVRLSFHICDNFSFPRSTSDSLARLPVQISGSRPNLIVSIGIPSRIYHTLPIALVQKQANIGVHAILFAQGINEQQILANLGGDSSFQDSVNQESTRLLDAYIAGWKSWVSNQAMIPSVYLRDIQSVSVSYPEELIEQLDRLMTELRHTVGTKPPIPPTARYSAPVSDSRLSLSSSAPSLPSLLELGPSPSFIPDGKKRGNMFKHQTTILLLASEITRLLGNCNPDSPSGHTRAYTFNLQASSMPTTVPNRVVVYPTPPVASRFTSCKSGKDRTALSVTYEQSLTHKSTMTTHLLATMRSERGVRIACIERNLGLGWGIHPNTEQEGLIDENRRVVMPVRGDVGRYAINALQYTVLPPIYRPPTRLINNRTQS